MRHIKIQIISAILLALITFSYMPLTLSASDYSAHFAKDAIDQLIAKGTVLPDSYGNVHPETYILRAVS